MAIKKKTVKKTVKKAATKKRAAAKKKAVVKAAPVKAIKDPMTKTQLYTTIADKTELSRKQVGAVMDALSEVINGHIKKNAAGTFTMPGLFKVKTVRKPATRARKGINPFTGEETVFKAKPARTLVKIQPLKKMKDMV